VVKKTKNPFIFTESQRQEIEEILVKIVREIQRTLDNLPDPKEYSDNILKDLKSGTKMAAVHLIMSSLNLKPDDEISSKEARKRLPQGIGMSIKPYHVTKAFGIAEKEGYFIKVKGSKKIRHPGRHRSNENIEHGRGGGRPSQSYQITEGFTKLKKFMSKTASNQLIHTKLKEEGIIQEYYKFLLLSFYYIIRMEDKTKGKTSDLARLIIPHYSDKVNINDTLPDWEAYVSNIFLRWNETEFDLVASRIASSLAENPLDCLYLLKILRKL
jgi:hypothetical protein